MKEITIKLNEITKIKQFVNEVTLIPCNVDLQRDHYIVDAKSIMGIMSLDISKPVKAILHSDDLEDIKLFESIIEKYKA